MYVLLYFKVYFHANILKPSGVPALFFFATRLYSLYDAYCFTLFF